MACIWARTVVANIVTGLISAVPGILGIFVSLIIRQKVREVHILVNSGYDAMKTEIDDLKEQRDLKAAKESND